MTEHAAAPGKDPLVVSEGPRLKLIGFLLKRLPALRYVMLRRRFLKDSGWVASMKASLPVDAEGEPIAWYTYAALQFLEPRIRPDMDVFEYGAGHSTLWWAKRAGSVSAVESEQKWVELLLPRLPDNARVDFCPLDFDGHYSRHAATLGVSFDIIVIDGLDRNNCAVRGLPVLKENGVIVWDNSDWSDYFQEGFHFLQAKGFSRLDFGGLGPLNGYGWTTSVFYRKGNNCLGL